MEKAIEKAVEKAVDPVIEEVPKQVALELHAGELTIRYPSEIRIKSVQIKGMRNKPMNLSHITWNDFLRMNPSMSGFPIYFAVEYKKHLIGFWPRPLLTLTVLIDRVDD